MNKTSIIIIGGGGHGLSVADVILADERFDLLGYIDQQDDAVLGSLGVPWLGNDCAIAETSAIAAHVGVGQIKSHERRAALFQQAIDTGLDMPVLSSRSATIASSATLGKGVLVMHQAVVNPIASVGLNTIINTAAVVEHGALIGDHCHIAPQVTVLGDASIGHHCFIGSGAIIREGVKIGNNSIIGAGAVIKHDVEGDMIVKGPDHL